MKKNFKVRRVTKSKFFQGEMMTCASCRVMRKSDPKIESGWNVFEVEGGEPFYICPQCFSDWISPYKTQRENLDDLS